MIRLAPSILSADFAALGEEIGRISAQADWLHVDIMDGHFVPNITIGPPVVAAIRQHTDLYLDCHLMISEPGRYLEAFKRAGADSCTVHLEVGGTGELIHQMRDLGMHAGCAINPETPFEEAERWLGDIDLLNVMSVHPGFGGQAFMPEVVPKIERAARLAAERHPHLLVEVDGGVDTATAPIVAGAGARVLVAGNAIFGAEDPVAAAAAIRGAAEHAAGEAA